MAKIENTIILHNEYVEIVVVKKGIEGYKHSVLLDIEDLIKCDGGVRISRRGYVFIRKQSKAGLSLNLSHRVMKHISNTTTVIDHINGNPMDNRKANLRVATQLENNHNKHSFILNNTGTVGIAYRRNGNYEYYRCSVTDRSKPKKSGKTVGACQRHTKQFNISRLGKVEAFTRAKEWLRKKKIELHYKTI